MPSVSRYRTWLAVPADEIEDLKKAHPPMNGHTPVIWDKEHKLWFARPGADLSMLDRWLPRPQEVSMNGSDPVTEFAQVLEKCRAGSERTAGHGRENPPCPDRR